VSNQEDSIICRKVFAHLKNGKLLVVRTEYKELCNVLSLCYSNIINYKYMTTIDNMIINLDTPLGLSD